MKPLIQPVEAAAIVAANMPMFPKMDCPIEKCAGRILREDVHADRPFPPFDRSMMDGFAFRTPDLAQTNRFQIMAEAPAGTARVVLDSALGSCIEIMTGAVVPEGADCVAPYETTERIEDRWIRMDAAEYRPGGAIHATGSDHSSGDALIRSGRRLGSRELAIAATCGYASLQVTQLPAICIVSTGDELVDITVQPEPHQIRRSNDRSIATALTLAGFPAQKCVHLVDEPDSATTILADLVAEYDIVLISGGISKGKKDFIPDALTHNGLTCHFHGVAQKPGKPLGFWSSDRSAVFALPGNPLSTLTCLHHYVLPALHAASGGKVPVALSVRLAEPIQGHPSLNVFFPVSLSDRFKARPQPTNNSGDLVSILASDGYIMLPAFDQIYPVDAEFNFYPWH